MTTTRDIVLGETTFAVPVLPIRHNRIVYPLCRDLSADGDDSFFARLVMKNGTPDAVRDDEWPKLIDIAFHAANAADKNLTREVFDEMPITPPQLVDALFVVRVQTGAWMASADTGSVDARPNKSSDADTEDHAGGEAVGA